MTMRGIRGATTIDADEQTEVFSATRELLEAIQQNNPDLDPCDIGSAIFTTTEDITSAFPATAARAIGWEQVPMVCAREIPVPNSLAGCIRVLIHWNTDKAQDAIRHIYLNRASALRPDLAEQQKINEAEGEKA